MNYEPPIIQYRGTLGAILSRLPAEPLRATHSSDWRVKKLQNFINAQDGKTGWDLAEICKELGLGISGTYAGKLFKRSTGMRLREYAKKKRLEKAAERLKTTARSIKEIAVDLGYRSPRVFTRTFKKTFYVSPTQYRRIHR